MTELTAVKQIKATALPESNNKSHLSPKQKAVIVIKFLINHGADLPLDQLPETLQIDLIHQMAAMPPVDQSTLADVIVEFANELDSVGLFFSNGLAGALTDLEGKISPVMARRLRKEAGVRQIGDPWDSVQTLPLDELGQLMRSESTEVASVILSKLKTSKAAELLGTLPGDQARRITYAISLTGNITPHAVDQIGSSLAAQIANKPEKAFEDTPVKRLGSILNVSAANIRDTLLSGLEEDDQTIGTQVRSYIFTFKHIPQKLQASDIPKCLRSVDKTVLATALAGAQQADMSDVATYLLESMSKRMADNLREDITELGKVKAREGEVAMKEIMIEIRRLIDTGEVDILLHSEEEETTAFEA